MSSIKHYVSGKDVFSMADLKKSNFYRELGLAIDANPAVMKDYLNNKYINELIFDKTSTCLERTKQYEYLAYGDAGVLLSAPGPSLAGIIIRELGNEDQKNMFFNYLISNRSRTFLAVTEPMHGTDANNLGTNLLCSGNNYYLSGEKCFVGNGAIGEIGVVIARTSPGYLGISAVLIMPGELGTISSPDAHIYRAVLPTVGLRGASLSHLLFNYYEINKNQILGQHLRIGDRGLMGLIKTFNRMRPCVGALALGLAQAVIDYACDLRQSWSDREKNILINLSLEISLIRKKLYQAASRVDEDVTDSAFVSLVKVNSTRIAEKAVNQVMELFGPDVFWEHPLLEKWHRDVLGFEYMEGTMQVHYKNISNNYFIDKKYKN